jgi:hypothetical protein
MEKRSPTDVLKLFLTGILVVAGLAIIFWIEDEKLRMSDRWQFFWTANICAFAAFLWYVRPLLRHRVSGVIVFAWAILRTAAAFELARRGTQIISLLITMPIEGYIVVILAKLSAKADS